jgi:hypothetical protein
MDKLIFIKFDSEDFYVEQSYHFNLDCTTFNSQYTKHKHFCEPI